MPRLSVAQDLQESMLSGWEGRQRPIKATLVGFVVCWLTYIEKRAGSSFLCVQLPFHVARDAVQKDVVTGFRCPEKTHAFIYSCWLAVM